MIDTDILIDALRGRLDAAVFLAQQQASGAPCISIVSRMELIPGCHDRRDQEALREFLQGFAILPLTPTGAESACLLLETFALTHGLRMPDALIAATALERGLCLFTRNRRHFQMIPDLAIECPY